MDKFQSLPAHSLLFDLASRLGSLEGYLYADEKVDSSYLPNWLRNIEREFSCLSPEVRGEIGAGYLELLRKVHALLRGIYGDQDTNTAKVAAMISNLSKKE